MDYDQNCVVFSHYKRWNFYENDIVSLDFKCLYDDISPFLQGQHFSPQFTKDGNTLLISCKD